MKLSKHESETRTLLKNELDREWSPNKQVVANVFNAMWSSSIPAEQVERVACAMFNFNSLNLRAELTQLVRRKVLRSRTHNGVRLYEVNY